MEFPLSIIASLPQNLNRSRLFPYREPASSFKTICDTTSTCAECMWQHKGAGGFITFLRPFSFRKQTLSKQKLPGAKELETE
jgi:hypothetical protein